MKYLTLLIGLIIISSTYSISPNNFDGEKYLIEDLRANYNEIGITASTGHFNDVWTRDSMFAAWGSLAIEDETIVKTTLRSLDKYSKEGQIPMKLAKGNQYLKLMGIPNTGPLVPYYITDKSKDPAMDSNCLYLYTLNKYAKQTGDYTVKIEEKVKWMKAQDTNQNNLIEQGKFADWADSVKRKGETLYVNSCYAAALQASYEYTGNEEYKKEYEETKKALKTFWNGKYYEEQTGNRILDVPANLMMIHFNLTNETTRILEAIEEASKENLILPVTTTPKHKPIEKNWILVLGGMGDYHEKQRWSWISGLYLGVLKEHDKELYEELVKEWEKKIEKDKGVYEVYEPDGKPLRRLLYKTQKPFAWGSGMMLWGLN